MKVGPRHPKFIRDISWLSFNERVLQEADDPSVPLRERLRFLGIFSNNLDEFFRVRVATLIRMRKFESRQKVGVTGKPSEILKRIQHIVLHQQTHFEQIYTRILREMRKQHIYIRNEKQLSARQKEFVRTYFTEKVQSHIVPIMLNRNSELPLLYDRSIYLACLLIRSKQSAQPQHALIEIPDRVLPRFILLPAPPGKKHILLLEDMVRFCLPQLFSQFGFDRYEAHILKMTRDAELDLDSDVQAGFIERIEKGLKNRRKGRPLRLVFDKEISKGFLQHLIRLFHLTRRDHLVPGGRIHNFKDFMQFPEDVFKPSKQKRPPSFIHPLLVQPVRILDVLEQRDVMLHFPYHSFDSIIDLLRESAIDPEVESIKITCYRLARESKVIHALIHAVRNGKKVLVSLELRARFDEEANLHWKQLLEEEGVQVRVGLPDQKIHAKIALITRKRNGKRSHFGFVSTGNLNESTARVYGDHCLLTSDPRITSDIARVFRTLEKPTNQEYLQTCKTLILSPVQTRIFFQKKILNEIHHQEKGKPAGVLLKLNSLSDDAMIESLYQAVQKNVPCQMIIRSINGAYTSLPDWPRPIQAISIVDEYLEHARVICFENAGKPDVYISSSDWMTRNLDYRIEVSAPVFDPLLQEELREILAIQLQENVKARVLDNLQQNQYVPYRKGDKKIRSQVAIYKYLRARKYP